MDRRRFLVASGGLVATAALAPRLAWARQAAELAGRPAVLQPWHLPSGPPSDPTELTRALIAAAILAPSEWNTQPWRFEAETNSIRLVGDTTRLLPYTDPDARGHLVSLGAALENLLVAARAYGLRPTVDYFPRPGANGVVV